MDTNEILIQLRKEILEIKKVLATPPAQTPLLDKWVSRRDVMSYLNYASTQMAALEKSGALIVAKVGKRKFILRESLEKLLEKSIQL